MISLPNKQINFHLTYVILERVSNDALILRTKFSAINKNVQVFKVLKKPNITPNTN